jgi:hypothetical protein
VDCVLILADNSCFDYAGIVRDARMVFNVRNATRDVANGREKIIRLRSTPWPLPPPAQRTEPSAGDSSP